jgi:3-hydroxybutyryl-CoA dehydrogenase
VTTPARLEQVGVIGNGIIGHGVAQVFAVAGLPVKMVGRSAKSLETAIGKIRASLDRFQAHGLVSESDARGALGRITTSRQLEDVADADLIVEAVTEVLALKHELFERLDRLCARPTILASSSGQPASKLVARVRHRERVVAAHFWNPSQLIPLVEVCAGPETDPEVVPWVCGVLRDVGKKPVTLDREIDGFIGNRLQFALLREALALWAEGVATPEAIDQAVKQSFGRRLAITGPLESADLGGLDTFYAFSAFLFPGLDTSSSPPEAMRSLAQAGHRGYSSGQGLYDWSTRDGQALSAARVEELFRHLERDNAEHSST